MEDVLVIVNRAHYFDGHRLDYESKFKQWMRQYVAGNFDKRSMRPVSTTEGAGLEKSRHSTAARPVAQNLV